MVEWGDNTACSAPERSKNEKPGAVDQLVYILVHDAKQHKNQETSCCCTVVQHYVLCGAVDSMACNAAVRQQTNLCEGKPEILDVYTT